MPHRKAKESKGIYCLEGIWWPQGKRHDSVEPMLRLLDQFQEYRVPFIYNRARFFESFENDLMDWSKRKYHDYPILYLAFHGEPGVIYVGDLRRKESVVSLDWIAETLEGKCTSRIIHFGSCQTLRIDKRHIRRFLDQTGALAVSGYTNDVDWIYSCGFELIYFANLQNYSFTTPGVKAAIKQIDENAKSLQKSLGFRILTRGE